VAQATKFIGPHGGALLLTHQGLEAGQAHRGYSVDLFGLEHCSLTVASVLEARLVMLAGYSWVLGISGWWVLVS
jgi:hypothetical protein